MNTQLAALIGSRICHDLISPIGAINNGLELLSMSGGAAGPEMGLIGESVDNASARIRFFRIAFGAAGEQKVGPVEVQSILRDLYGNGRLTLEWRINEPVERRNVRLAFLGLMCAETAMPYGGQLSFSTVGETWTLNGKADRISLDPELREVMTGDRSGAALQPSQVQFALLPLVAGDEGRGISFEAAETTLALSF